MKFRGALAAFAAASLIAAPAVAEASFDRISAPVEGENAGGGSGGGLVLGVVAAVLIIGGIVIAAGGDSDPISG